VKGEKGDPGVGSESYDPRISLIGDPNMTIQEGVTYVEQGATAIDFDDADITADMNITGNVGSTPDVYSVNYDVSDSFERSSTLTRKVKVIGTERILLLQAGQTEVLTSVPIIFLDSGDAGNYDDRESFDITFDGGSIGTFTMVLNSCTFEHTALSMYDRLGMQTSTDGINFTNVLVPGFETSVTSTPPWSGGSTNASSGYIFPKTADTLAGTTITFSSRFLRFYFSSDGNGTKPGWNLTLSFNN
jgi:hypothetical protein